MALHRGGEVDLAAGLLCPVLAAGHIDVRNGGLRLCGIVDELRPGRGLLLLVPVVVGHGRRALSRVLNLGVGAGLIGLRYLGHVEFVAVGLALVSIAVLGEVAGESNDVVQLLRLVEVNRSSVTEDVVTGCEGDLLRHGGERRLAVLHRLVRGQGLLVAADAEDVDVGRSVADDDIHGTSGEDVGHKVVDDALDLAVDEDANPVQALHAIDDVHGDMDFLALGPGGVLVIADALVLRHHIDFLREQPDAVGVAVNGVRGANLQYRLILVEDVVGTDVHLQRHAPSGGVP